MDDVQIAKLMISFRDHGDRESWEQLYDVCRHRIRGYLYKRVGNHVIDDCCNEFWLQLHLILQNYEYNPDQRPLKWLLRGSSYHAKRFLKKYNRQTGLKHYTRIDWPDNTEIVDPIKTPPEQLMRDETCQIVRETITSIRNSKVRDLARAYFLEGRVAKDVADEAGINRNTAWCHLHEARQEIKRKLSRRLESV